MDRFFAQKLQLCDADVIRLTNVQMRCVQFMESESAAPAPASGFHGRRAFSLFELVYALRMWRR